MEPLSPQDPLHTLLGHGRTVEARANFTQNVLRAVRQLPQRLTLGERLRDFFQALFGRPVFLAACAAVLVAATGLWWTPAQHSIGTAGDQIAQANDSTQQGNLTAAETPGPESEVAVALNDMDRLSVLLAQQDTRAMTDTEIAFLIY